MLVCWSGDSWSSLETLLSFCHFLYFDRHVRCWYLSHTRTSLLLTFIIFAKKTPYLTDGFWDLGLDRRTSGRGWLTTLHLTSHSSGYRPFLCTVPNPPCVLAINKTSLRRLLGSFLTCFSAWVIRFELSDILLPVAWTPWKCEKSNTNATSKKNARS